MARLLLESAFRRWRWRVVRFLLLFMVAVPGCGRGGRDKDDDDKVPAKNPSETASTTAPGADRDQEGKVKLTAASVEQYGLRIATVKAQLLVPTFVAPGRVAFDAEAMARVGSAVPGRVVEMNVRRGDMVRKGDELLVVESTDLGEAQSDYLQKKTALAASVAAVEPARTSYERAKGLYDQSQGISLAEMQKREADLRAAEALREAAQGAAAAAARKLTLLGVTQDSVATMVKSGQVTPRYLIRAPISGRVIERDVTLGQFVTPDRDSLIQLADTSTMWVLAAVPEARLHDVSVGSTVRVAVPAGGSALQGVVSFIPSSVDPTTRSAEVRVAVRGDEASSLKAGMFAEVEIEAMTQKQTRTIAVPEEAIQILDGQPCVFVEDDEENTFLKRSVAVGNEVNSLVPVLSGLKEKERIVVAGGFFLKAEFAKVAVKDND